MNILITGGTGFVGSKLTEILSEERDHVYILTRSKKTSDHPFIHYIQYDPGNIEDTSWHDEMPGHIDTIYNLAGESLTQLWTEEAKERIFESRVNVTKILYKYVEAATVKPSVLVNASAIGYYPVSESVEYDESHSFHPVNFLAEVVSAWEHEAWKFKELGTRVVVTRFGLTLDGDEGVLSIMALPYKFGLGGKVGSGEQWYSWIHIDDLLNGLLYVTVKEDIEGPVNLTAPIPLRQNQFSSYLSSILGKPDVMKVPRFVVEKALGDLSVMVVKGQKVLPQMLLDHDFKFLFPSLDLALEDIYGDK